MNLSSQYPIVAAVLVLVMIVDIVMCIRTRRMSMEKESGFAIVANILGFISAISLLTLSYLNSWEIVANTAALWFFLLLITPILGLLVGIVTYVVEHSKRSRGSITGAQWGMILCGISLILFFAMNGTQNFCIDNYACSAMPTGVCSGYPSGLRIGNLYPGRCTFTGPIPN